MSDRVLVLGDDVRAFLAVARSLGRRGLEVHAVPTDPVAPALASRFLAAIHAIPAYALAPEGWEAALRRLIAKFDYRMVVPCSDSSLIQLRHHAEALGRERLALPNAEAFAVFTDKARTRSLAQRLGVAVAEGQALSSGDDARRLASRYGLPLLLKPAASYRLRDSADKRSVEMLRDARSLELVLAAGGWRGCIVEGFFPGEGVGVSVLAGKGRILQAYQHRRLRQATETGVSTSRVSEPVDPLLLRDVAALAEAVALDGIAMFEFRHDRQSGRHVLLEVNPRFWGSLPLALAAGADFPAMLYDLHQGTEPATRFYRSGAVKSDLSGEYERRVRQSEAAETRLARLAWMVAALLTPFTLRRKEADSWAADDPAPYRAERRELSERILHAARKRLRPRLRRVARSPLAVPGELKGA